MNTKRSSAGDVLVVFRLVVIGLIIASLPLPASEAAKPVAFDIPAGAAIESFQRFTAQSGVQLLYAVDELAGVRTAPVKGELTAGAAVDRMLAGTNLIAVQTANGAIGIKRDPSPKTRRVAQVAQSGRPNQERAPTAVAEDEPITLSPFEVRTDGDVGYLAANSLAGSRLNTALKDTAASISVFTEEFIKDVGAIDLSELMAYAGNAQMDLVRPPTTPR